MSETFGTGNWIGVSQLVDMRVESNVASAYRLAKKPNGDLILQGRFDWTEGLKNGHEWRDIPTVEAA